MIINTQIAGGGITPSGTISITSNGTYDVTRYASANVSVSGGGDADYGAFIARSTNTPTLPRYRGSDGLGRPSLLGLTMARATIVP